MMEVVRGDAMYVCEIYLAIDDVKLVNGIHDYYYY